MQPLGTVRISEDATVQDEGHRIEEAPGGRACFLHLLERGGVPLGHDHGDALDVQDAGTEELQNGVVCTPPSSLPSKRTGRDKSCIGNWHMRTTGLPLSL